MTQNVTATAGSFAARPSDGGATAAVVSGVTWFDDRSEPVNAHGCCVIEHDGRFWLFGEHKTDGDNAFRGFACYSSVDLVSWRFERLVLPRQKAGLLGPDRVGERPKVMRCPGTGLFMLYAHADDLRYTDPHVVVAVSESIDGEFELHGPVTFEGQPVRRWDIGAFQDEDGRGYLLVHEGDVYRLSKDYCFAEEKVAAGLAPGGESPAMLRAGGLYHLLLSNKTSWERNDNFYLSAPTVAGPWTHRGLLAPAGTLTHDSQCSFVLRLGSGGNARHVYLGDRWSPRYQASAATQVWLPLNTEDTALSLPPSDAPWDPSTGAEVDLGGTHVPISFASRTAGAVFEFPFEGTRVGVEGVADNHSGYARVEVVPEGADAPASSLVVDHASAAGHQGLRHLSPVLPRGRYTLRVIVTGEHHTWSDKSGRGYGSSDCWVTVTGVRVFDDTASEPTAPARDQEDNR